MRFEVFKNVREVRIDETSVKIWLEDGRVINVIPVIDPDEIQRCRAENYIDPSCIEEMIQLQWYSLEDNGTRTEAIHSNAYNDLKDLLS